MIHDPDRHPASFRDPSGYVFRRDSVLWRAITPLGEASYRSLMDTGLYEELSTAGLLVRHVDCGLGAASLPADCRAIRPELLPIISHPAEWTFAQLKSAALLTLDIQLRALARGVTLKDASAFNVQFAGTRPVLVDTLSFEPAGPQGAWVAYRQFCQHFVAPLALISYFGLDIVNAWGTSIEGIPLDLASRLLPQRTWLATGLLLHVHLHSRVRASSSERPSASELAASSGFVPRLVKSLQCAVTKIAAPRISPSPWPAYRSSKAYSTSDAATKRQFVEDCVDVVRPRTAIDLGANDGEYTELLARRGVAVTAVELDAACCERLYSNAVATTPGLVTTLRVDIANPTPAFGWDGTERASFAERLNVDLAVVLALLHHLCLSRHIPLLAVVRFLARFAQHVAIEFVPPTDPLAREMLQARGITAESIGYDEASFIEAFHGLFETLCRSAPFATGRTVFLFRRRLG